MSRDPDYQMSSKCHKVANWRTFGYNFDPKYLANSKSRGKIQIKVFLDAFDLSEFKSELSLSPKNFVRSLLNLSCLVVRNCTNYYGALKVRLEDTGLWFIDSARFARWKATADDFIWICGTRMYSHHLRIILGSKLVRQLVQARLS